MSKYVLIHINKCGGGSLFTTFSKKASGLGITQIHTEQMFNKFEDLLINDNIKVFFFIRDPVERFISSYNFVSNQFRNIITKRRFKGYFNITYNEIPDFNEVVSRMKDDVHFKKFMIELDPHLQANIAFYLNYKGPTFLDQIRDKIIFVGTVENFKNDYNQLLEKISLDSNFTFPDDMELNYVHKTTKVGNPVSQDAIDYIRTSSADDYACIQKLIDFGLLPQSYLDQMLVKTDYTW